MIKKHNKIIVDKSLPEVSSNNFAIKLTPNVFFISIAVALVVGCIVGLYGYQFKAYVGYIFGYQKNPIAIDLSSVEKTYYELASSYDGKLISEKLIQGANKGMVDAVGDAYTVYMTADEALEYNKGLEGNIGGGIGALIGLRNNRTTIMSVLDDNPAIKAGLKAGDKILEINDQSTEGMSVDLAVSNIRGKEDTTVKLLIERDGEEMSFTVTRAIINSPSVTSKIENDVGIMTISRFDESTDNLATIAAKNFIKEDVSRVVLDLRNNPGGYVDSAINVASLWLDNKTVVTERKDGKIIETLKSKRDPILGGVKTVILVNESSASASEIVAGALQDYGVAEVVGHRTYGKGSVQKLARLEDGAELKVTIAKWYTPKGKNITSEGVVPDHGVDLTQKDVDDGLDPQLDKALQLLAE